MSTAHRPTWKAKSGGGGLKDGASAPPTFQTSSKDQPSHKKLKYRQLDAGAPVDEHEEYFNSARQANDNFEDDTDNGIDEDHSGMKDGADVKDGNISTTSDDQSDESSDDEEALLAELEKIRAERAAKAETKAEMGRVRAVTDNSGLIKRRWEDEGVVFRRKASSGSASSEKRFINDTVRSDYHRSFMDKFVK